jgi:ABC-type spermidine/putrescine transport system permease subunit II
MATRNQSGDFVTIAAVRALVIATAIFMISPILLIIPMSFSSGPYLEFPPPGWSLRWYDTVLSNTDWLSAFLVSLEVACLATVFSTLLGVPAAFALARAKLKNSYILLAIVSLPLVFPVIASAVALYFVFSDLHLVGSRLGLAIGHTILALPIVVLPIFAVLRRFDERIEWQAMNLGASEWRTLVTVTFPLLRPALYTVMIFAFITSFDEVIFAIFLSSGGATTLPKKIWLGLRFELEPTVAAVAVFLLLISSGVIALAWMLHWRARYAPIKAQDSVVWKSIG